MDSVLSILKSGTNVEQIKSLLEFKVSFRQDSLRANVCIDRNGFIPGVTQRNGAIFNTNSWRKLVSTNVTYSVEESPWDANSVLSRPRNCAPFAEARTFIAVFVGSCHRPCSEPDEFNPQPPNLLPWDHLLLIFSSTSKFSKRSSPLRFFGRIW
jgi:hypothetical protein